VLDVFTTQPLSLSLSISRFSIQAGTTALLWAVDKGHVNIVELLLARKGIEINMTNKVFIV
jgi:ankyrin repeat protein